MSKITLHNVTFLGKSILYRLWYHKTFIVCVYISPGDNKLNTIMKKDSVNVYFRLSYHQDTVDIFHEPVILFKELITHIQVGNMCPRQHNPHGHFNSIVV